LDLIYLSCLLQRILLLFVRLLFLIWFLFRLSTSSFNTPWSTSKLSLSLNVLCRLWPVFLNLINFDHLLIINIFLSFKETNIISTLSYTWYRIMSKLKTLKTINGSNTLIIFIINSAIEFIIIRLHHNMLTLLPFILYDWS